MAEIPIIGAQTERNPSTGNGSEANPSEVNASAPATREANSGFEKYRERQLYRWELIERAFQQAQVGLHNNLIELRKADNAREFHSQHDVLTDRFLTTTEFLFRAFHGYKDRQPE